MDIYEEIGRDGNIEEGVSPIEYVVLNCAR